jgi:3-hydroxyacyl-CoA dehydrogenase
MVRRMTHPIRRVAVLGAGVMGSGIAAHCANAGIPVLLLDLKTPSLDPIRKAKPAALMHPRNALLIQTGNFEEDLAKVANCDLIIEAIVERLDIKRGMFEKLEKLMAPHAVIASNTSGLRIADMLVGRTEQFKQNFMVTHFFNPPRYMKLLELVAGPETSADARQLGEDFGKTLGKGIVWAKDTPNFIGNRIGLQSMMSTIHLMLERGLAPEDVDNITGIAMAHPKSATFRTADVVGLDTVGHVAANCYNSLTDDEDRDTFKTPDYILKMIEAKQLGDKTKGGFYKKVGPDLQTLDPTTGQYRAKGGDEAIAKATKAVARLEDPKARVAKLVAQPRVRRAPHPGDHAGRGRHRGDRQRHEVGLRVGPRSVRDLGRARLPDDGGPHEAGRREAAGVDRHHARGQRDGLLRRRQDLVAGERRVRAA